TPRSLELPQVGPLHLARRRHRQGLDEFYLTGVLVRRQTGAHVRLELAGEPGRPLDSLAELHECLDHLAPDRTGRAARRRPSNCRMALQTVLDLARADPVATARDQVVLAPDEPEVAVRVLPGQVAGEGPVTHELLAGGRLVVPVAQEHDRIGALHG